MPLMKPPSKPKLLIANYVLGPANCIAHSSYYSVCCLSECDTILADLERHVAAPSSSPENLLALVHNMSDNALPRGLIEKLHGIAARHNGEVPLHGRLFAQWLHFAFPYECPYPSILESNTTLTASAWLNGVMISKEERKEHAEMFSAPATLQSEDIGIDGRWSDHEVLPMLGQSRASFVQLSIGLARIAVQVVALIFIGRRVYHAWCTASFPIDPAKKDDDHMMSRFV